MDIHYKHGIKKAQNTTHTNNGCTATDITATKTKEDETTNPTNHEKRTQNDGGRGSTTKASL